MKLSLLLILLSSISMISCVKKEIPAATRAYSHLVPYNSGTEVYGFGLIAGQMEYTDQCEVRFYKMVALANAGHVTYCSSRLDLSNTYTEIYLDTTVRKIMRYKPYAPLRLDTCPVMWLIPFQ